MRILPAVAILLGSALAGAQGPVLARDESGGKLAIAAAASDAKYLARYETMRTAPAWSASVQHVRGGGMTVGVSGGF